MEGCIQWNFQHQGNLGRNKEKKNKAQIYNNLWHAAIPSKISIFAWRLLKDFIPTDQKMKQFGFSLPSKCQCCENEESTKHTFLTSPVANLVWHHFGADFGITHNFNSVEELIMAWSRSHDWITRGHIRTWVPLVILWAIWKARNFSKHKGSKIKPENIIACAEKKIQSIIQTNLLKKIHFKGESNTITRIRSQKSESSKRSIMVFPWSKPLLPWVKLNVDGCSKGNPGLSSAGGLLRDCDGKIVFSFFMNLGTSTAYMAELYAIKEGLKLCKQKNVNYIWIETDSQNIMNQINQEHKGNWKTYKILREIKELLTNVNWRCSHTYREANAAADALANAGSLASTPFAVVCDQPSNLVKAIVRMDTAGIKYFREVNTPVLRLAVGGNCCRESRVFR